MKGIGTCALVVALCMVSTVASATETLPHATFARTVEEKSDAAIGQKSHMQSDAVQAQHGAATDETPLVGGWQATESPCVTEDVRTAFDKAMEGYAGSSYKPVAYLGCQVVAGRNVCILAKATVARLNAIPDDALVYIYGDPEGNAAITHIARLDMVALSEK